MYVQRRANGRRATYIRRDGLRPTYQCTYENTYDDHTYVRVGMKVRTKVRMNMRCTTDDLRRKRRQRTTNDVRRANVRRTTNVRKIVRRRTNVLPTYYLHTTYLRRTFDVRHKTYVRRRTTTYDVRRRKTYGELRRRSMTYVRLT